MFRNKDGWKIAKAINPEPGTLNPDRLDVQFSCNPTTVRESQLFFQAEWRGLEYRPRKESQVIGSIFRQKAPFPDEDFGS